MKMKTIFVFAALLAFSVGNSLAAVGWAGNIWPCSGSSHLPTENINVYVQVWKGGVTDMGGQGADIAAELFYKKASDAVYSSVAMTYQGDVGSNDEYTGTIPSSATNGGENMDFYVEVTDLTDMAVYTDIHDQEQCGTNAPPLYLVILQGGLTQDVVVTFRIDMGCTNPAYYAGGVNFVGSHTGWGMCTPGTEMYDDATHGDDVAGDGVFAGQWTFYTGWGYDYAYKFQRNDGVSCIWGDMGDIPLTIDDSSPSMVLDVQNWVNNPWGPGEIAGPGSYCVGLDCVNELWVYLNTSYDPPTISAITMVPGCMDCGNLECAAGSGDLVWEIRQGGDMNWYLVTSIDGENAVSGCFCITIDAILPVELIGFDAIPGDNEVTLKWSTASEIDNDYFSIVRDGEEMNRVEASGNATGSEYVWVDNSVSNGVTYSYSLINVDLNGSRSMLETASVTPNRSNANVMEYSLSQNYPNPFNPSTSIAYSIEEASLVNITVFDITGREVAELVNGVMAAGSHSVEFDAAGLPSGIYMYRMEAGEFSAVQKMVLMK